MIICKELQTTNPSKIIFSIILKEALTSNEAPELRLKVSDFLNSFAEIIYIDTSEVFNCDLSGINEIIHSNYIATNASKKIILVYKKESTVANWVNITALDRFIPTALIPI